MKNLMVVSILVLSFMFGQTSLGGEPYSFTHQMDDSVGLIETGIVVQLPL